MQLQHARSAAKYLNICRSEEREMHERGVVKRDTALYRRWERTEHGYGNRDQSRLLRKVEVRDMCGWYLEYRFGTQMHRRE